MPKPTEEEIRMLYSIGVGLVVSLTEDPLPYSLASIFGEKMLHNGQTPQLLHLAVYDYCVPTVEQVEVFLAASQRVIAAGKAVAVHCLGGVGRTGTMLACFVKRTKNVDGDAAVQLVRSKRPGSIVTLEQHNFVLQF
jgi:atypical dual specificity phosphatase